MHTIPIKQQGNVLVAGLIFVMVLTVLGVGAMQSSNLEYRMSTNTAFKKNAFEYSESGRAAMTQVLSQHLSEDSWTGVTMDGGLSILDNDGVSGADLMSENEGTETVGNPEEDAEYYIDVDGDGTNDLVAEVSVYSFDPIASPGSSLGQFGGSEGAGKSGGKGTYRRVLQVVSDGIGPSNARAAVATDFRHVIN